MPSALNLTIALHTAVLEHRNLGAMSKYILLHVNELFVPFKPLSKTIFVVAYFMDVEMTERKKNTPNDTDNSREMTSKF